jgi:acetyltransferase-like isoleucine patch superfamily enzyme
VLRISSSAKVSAGAKLGEDVVIGDFTVVHDEVEIGDGTVIESHCVVGAPPVRGDRRLTVGRRTLVRSHSVLYGGSILGEALVTGTHAVIRERSRLGQGVQIGAFTELQGDLTIGDYTRTQSSVFIPKNCSIGAFVWLMPHVCLTNDPYPPSDDDDRGAVIEDYAVLCARAVVLPGIRIGTRAVVGAQSLVTRDVPPDALAVGVPARVRGKAAEVMMRQGKGPAYPWTTHFGRGYPDDIVARWRGRQP